MSTITKERLEPVIERLEHYATNVKWTNVQAAQDMLTATDAMRRLLASLEAEPVAWLWSHRKHPSEVSLVRPEDDERAEGAHWSGWSCQALYAAPPAPVSVPDDIDTRMKNAGMLSAAEIIAGQPIDAFLKHAGVVDLESLLKWSEMRRAEFLRMQAKYELGDNQKDDMYEWVISHVAAFSELHVNIRAAMLQGAEPVTTDYKLPANTPCKDAPEHIWLQTAGVWPENGEFSELTWCSDNQHPDDTLYVRADVVSGNSPVIPDEVFSAVRKVARIRADFDDFDGDRRGIGDCLDEAEQELIVTINKHASVIAAAPQQEVK